jgi:hypothetical protein
MMHCNIAPENRGEREQTLQFRPFSSQFQEITMNATTEQFASANKATVETLLTVRQHGIRQRRAPCRPEPEHRPRHAGRQRCQRQGPARRQGRAATGRHATTLAQPAVEKAVAYSRSVYEIATQTQEELSKVVEGQFSEMNKNVATALDKAAKNAPAGSDVAVAAVKSAIAAANSAYDSMTKAAKQVAEIAEANVAAATTATVKAVGTGAAAPKAKKAA